MHAAPQHAAAHFASIVLCEQLVRCPWLWSRTLHRMLIWLSSHVLQAKCTLGNETRLVQLSGISTYAELMHSVRAKFPSAGHFQLKYLDRCATEFVTRVAASVCGSCQLYKGQSGYLASTARLPIMRA